MVTDILDWPLESGGEDAMFWCAMRTETVHRDRRCRTGYRTEHQQCFQAIGDWDTTLRELLAAVEAHARDAHGWTPS
jgi:hypothetical protein